MGLARLGQVRLTSGPTYFALFFFWLGWAKHVQPISFLIERDERQQNVSQFTSHMPHLEEKKEKDGYRLLKEEDYLVQGLYVGCTCCDH
jgi:hypothetical protein